MVAIVHNTGTRSHSTKSTSPVSWMVSNRSGSYGLFSQDVQSRFEGLHMFEQGEMYRIVESIEAEDQSPVVKIENNVHNIVVHRKKTSTEYCMPLGKHALLIESSKKQTHHIFGDVKKAFDDRVWGRDYTYQTKQGCLVFSYKKKNDGNEPNGEEYQAYIAIKSDGTLRPDCNTWVEHAYNFDQKRQSPPGVRHVVQLASCNGAKIAIGAGLTEKQALNNCKQLFSKSKQLKKEHAQFVDKKCNESTLNKKTPKQLKVAESVAKSSLRSLRLDDGHIFAGLPWFFQRWARDELISLGGLHLGPAPTSVKHILTDYAAILSSAQKSVVGSEVRTNADANGWLYNRIHMLRFIAKKKPKIFLSQLQSIIDHETMKFTQNSIAAYPNNETWMDSIDRSGAPIEMQALRLQSYKSMHAITGTKTYKYLEEKMAKVVREQFWNGKTLLDRLNDESVRPNLFIAYYVYPELLTKKEWKQCFDAVLKELWLPWGGLATLSKKDSRFVSDHTGQDPRSYHNGDSWFWINNLAAVCMARLDKSKYKTKINAILKASTADLLATGVIGHSSELSSASKRLAQGSPVQAWSAALFLELLDTLHGN